jgi:hypothetical protein
MLRFNGAGLVSDGLGGPFSKRPSGPPLWPSPRTVPYRYLSHSVAWGPSGDPLRPYTALCRAGAQAEQSMPSWNGDAHC